MIPFGSLILRRCHFILRWIPLILKGFPFNCKVRFPLVLRRFPLILMRVSLKGQRELSRQDSAKFLQFLNSKAMSFYSKVISFNSKGISFDSKVQLGRFPLILTRFPLKGNRLRIKGNPGKSTKVQRRLFQIASKEVHLCFPLIP